NTADNAIFMFNYQSPDCDPAEGSLSQVIQGCQTVAVHPFSDFHLLLLDKAPLPEWNVYYAGWSRDSLPQSNVTTIHHPSGDVKKISKSAGPTFPSGYLPIPDDGFAYWK